MDTTADHDHDNSMTTWICTILTILLTLGISWIFAPALRVAFSSSSSSSSSREQPHTVIEWDDDGDKPKTKKTKSTDEDNDILLSLVIPAYNEEERIGIMLEEAHTYLCSKAGHALCQRLLLLSQTQTSTTTRSKTTSKKIIIEWIVVNDGSRDATTNSIQQEWKRQQEQQSSSTTTNHHRRRILSLTQNAGKGAAVQTGMLNAHGQWILMVDADGATEFGTGLERLVESIATKDETQKKKIALFGSRAHLQKQPQQKRGLVRTLLMYGFHFFVSVLVSNRIHDTQCGFKLFPRDVARVVFDSLHLQRWAFDIELVWLCHHECDIPIIEVDVPWQEVDGSKLNTSKFALAWVSITMLRDMLCVRLCYTLGIWKVSSRYQR